MDIKEQFLDKKNLNFIYKEVNSNLKKQQVKVEDKAQYKKIVKKLCKSISKNPTAGNIFSLVELNNYAVTKIIPFVLNVFQSKEPIGNDEALNNIYSSIDSNEPVDTLGNLTDSTIDSTTDFTNDTALDSIKFLNELKKKQDERNYDPDPNFRDSIKIAEQKTKDSITNQNKFTLSDRDDNEFFKNLYENNLTAHRPNIISKEKLDRHKELNKLKDKLINKQTSIEDLEFLNVRNMELNYESITDSNPTPFTNILKDQTESNVISYETSDNKEIQEIDKKVDTTVGLYAAGKYINNWNNTEYLVLDIELGESVPSWKPLDKQSAKTTTQNMIVDLASSLNIDKPSNVILEFLSFQDISTNDSLNRHIENMPYFVFEINEIQSKIVSNNPNLMNKFIIPNESYGKSTHETSSDKNTLSTVTVKLKTNYLTTMNPTNFLRLTISVWGLSRQSVDTTELLDTTLISEQDRASAAGDGTVSENKIQVSIFNDISLNTTIAFNNTATELNTGYCVTSTIGALLTERTVYEITFGDGDKCAMSEDETLIVKLTRKLEGTAADNSGIELVANTTILFFDKLLVSNTAVNANAAIGVGEFNIKQIKKVNPGSNLVTLYGHSHSRIIMGLLFKKI